jgi:hypothetical protein
MRIANCKNQYLMELCGEMILEGAVVCRKGDCRVNDRSE